jgi:hypothetical protein
MPRNSAAYDEDFYAWTQEQATLLRSGQFSRVDIENVAEELESMGRRDKRELDSRLEVLLVHLLKWQLQVQMRSPGWSGTIREQRRRNRKSCAIAELTRGVWSADPGGLYRGTRERQETGLPETKLPDRCPFTLEQILGEDFLGSLSRRAAGAARRARS